MDNKLRIFKWRKIGCILFLSMIVIMLITVLALGYFISLFDTENTFVISILFFLPLLIIGYSLSFLFSSFLYPEIGWIGIENSELTISVKNRKETYSKSEISKIKFIYKGDSEWQPIYKSMTRYIRQGSDYLVAGERFDKIIINETPYFVKVKNERDKNSFYQIIEWSEKNNIEFSLI